MTYTARFINVDELHYVKYLFSNDPTTVRVELSETEQDELIETLRQRLLGDRVKICMTFEDDTPFAMYVGTEIPDINGWFIGFTKILHSSNHFNTTAPIIAPALNMLIEYMESKGYYKFWMAGPEKHHNIRNKIMRRHSVMLDRYDWFDELVIPKNSLSGKSLFDDYRIIVDWTDILVRIFILRQEHRVNLIKGQNFDDYVGTVL